MEVHKNGAIPTNCSGDEPINVNRGVLQGSIISPILFNIYINDLVQELDGITFEVLAYADDIAVICQSDSELFSVMDVLDKWCISNHFTVNKKKSGIFVIANGSLRDSDEICGYPIKLRYKYLGINFNNKMNPMPHLDEVDKKLIIYIKKNQLLIKQYFSPKTLIQIANYFQKSRLIYGMASYLDLPEIVNKVERTRMRCLKSVMGSKDSTSSNRFRLALGIPLIEYELFFRAMNISKKYEENFKEKAWIINDIIEVFKRDLEITAADTIDTMKDKALQESAARLAKEERINIGNAGYNIITKRMLYQWLDHRDHYVIKYIVGYGRFNQRLFPSCKHCGKQNSRTHFTNECDQGTEARHKLLKSLERTGINLEEDNFEDLIMKWFFNPEPREDKTLKKIWDGIKSFICSLYWGDNQ